MAPASKTKKSNSLTGLSTVASQGSIALTQSLSLKSILHIPKLPVSLLSIHHITNDLNCGVTFFTT